MKTVSGETRSRVRIPVPPPEQPIRAAAAEGQVFRRSSAPYRSRFGLESLSLAICDLGGWPAVLRRRPGCFPGSAACGSAVSWWSTCLLDHSGRGRRRGVRNKAMARPSENLVVVGAGSPCLAWSRDRGMRRTYLKYCNPRIRGRSVLESRPWEIRNEPL